jgi:DNA-3-methyladenine glycosylase II
MRSFTLHPRTGTLRAKPPFDFEKSLRFLQGFTPLNGEQEIIDGTLTKGLMVDGRMVVVRASANKDKDGVYYELFSEGDIGDALTDRVAAQVSFFLSLDDDLAQFYSIAQKDPTFYPIVKKMVGLHHVKFPSLFEVSCWALLSQRSRMSVAHKAKLALAKRFGGSMELDGRTYRAFPDYETLRIAKVKDLLDATKNSRSAERLSAFVSSFSDLDERFLKTAPYEKADERLKRIKGIGDWSAQFVLFRGLGRIQRLQPNMGPLLKMMEETYGPEMTLDQINATYGEWCGYWSLYLRGSRIASFAEAE